MNTADNSLKQQQDAENDTRFAAPAKLQRYEQIIAAFSAMTPDEQTQLAVWEATNLPGDGTIGTSDWPRWDEIIARKVTS